jgi:hypothetical protein
MMPQDGFAPPKPRFADRSQAAELWERRYAARQDSPMSKLRQHDGIAFPAERQSRSAAWRRP